MLRPGQALAVAWRNKLLLNGRAQRSEYWWTVLAYGALSVAIIFLDYLLFPAGMTGDMSFDYETAGWSGFVNDLNAYPISNFIYYIFLMPLTFQAMRRLHDTGRSGWLAIIVAVLTFFMNYMPSGGIETHYLNATLGQFDTADVSLTDWAIITFWIAVFGFSLWQFVLNLLPSQKGTNRYGPNPQDVGRLDVFA